MCEKYKAFSEVIEDKFVIQLGKTDKQKTLSSVELITLATKNITKHLLFDNTFNRPPHSPYSYNIGKFLTWGKRKSYNIRQLFLKIKGVSQYPFHKEFQ